MIIKFINKALLVWFRLHTFIKEMYMAISLDNVGSGFKRSSINDNFTTIQDEINNNVLTKDGGTPLTADLDMNGNGVINASSVSTTSLTLNGNILTPTDLATSTLPDQTGNAGKLITTDGAGASWEEKEVEFFESIAALKAESIAAGRIVKTKQYYATPTNTGEGAATYKIVTALDFGGSPDEYGNHTLANGNVAVLQSANLEDVRQYGARGDGTTDDSTAIQSAIDKVALDGGGTVLLPMSQAGGDYRVSVTKGINDKYGIRVSSSNITLKGEGGAQLRRLSSDISTYALSFPILLIGVPDSNATQVVNTVVEGIKFYGENSRHTSNGSGLMDGRQAIWVKNSKGSTISRCSFENIDSSAIWFQSPSQYDYENAQYYNTTKCYDGQVSNCRFIAQPHVVAGRALLHAIVCTMDNVRILDNYFEWCDVGVSCATTYDGYDDSEDDTYIDPNLGVAVKRVGRGYLVKGNVFYNSSEHSQYLDGMNIVCTGNVISVDNSSICNTSQLQVRGRGVSITGNTLTGVYSAIGINTGSMDVVFQGNSIQAVGDSQGGVVNIQSQGLTTYINNRSAYFTSYKPQRNIVVSDNTIDLPNSAQTNGVGIRLYTDAVDANFPDGQMQNVVIKGNSVNRPRKAILTLAALARNVVIDSNIFQGKDFTESGFSLATVMDSEYVLGIDDSIPLSALNFTFNNNTVWGFEYVMFDDGGPGVAGTFQLPSGVRGNNFDYIKYWGTAAFTKPTFQTMFQHNVGRSFLDRTGWFSNTAILNALSDGTSNTEKKSMLQLVSSSDVRFYYDDAGGFKAL